MPPGILCDDCGTTVPSLGSLQMHRLRYHSRPAAALPAGGPQQRSAPGRRPARGRGAAATHGRPSRNRSGGSAAGLLGIAIAILLAGGAYGATRVPGSEGPSTADLTALARRAVLNQADFPAGWTADAPAAADGPDEGDRALAECLGAPYDGSPKAAETSFSSEGMSATSEFSVAPSQAWAQADFATLLDGGAPNCFEQVMGAMINAQKPAGATYEIDVTRLDVATLLPAAVAPNAVGLRAAIALHQNGTTFPLTFDAIMIRHDRIEATIGFNSVGDKAFPDDLRRSLTTAVVTRLTS